MEKNEVLGEMLYMGLVFEKGRCKSGKIWKYSYIQSLRKHIGLLKEIAACMRNPFQIIEDNIFLRGVCHEILNDKILKIHYPFCKEINIINSEETLITECKDENKYGEIIHFINQLLDDVLLELNKGYRKDKEKIIKTIFAAHNLPRVYLKRRKYIMFTGTSWYQSKRSFAIFKIEYG